MPVSEGADALLTATHTANRNWRAVGSAGNPIFYTNWSNYLNNYAPAAFCLEYRTVRLRGVVNQVGSGIAIFTLPPGYRPAKIEVFPSLSGRYELNIEIDYNGLIYVTSPNRAPTSDIGMVTLSGISFDVT